MRVLLVNPPRSPCNAILEYAPSDAKKFIHRKLVGPPLGLLVVAEALRNHDVTVLDLKGEYDLNPSAGSIEQITIEYLEKINPDIVGVTFIASEFPDGMRIFETAKKFNPNITTVAGGIHATLSPFDFNGGLVDIVAPGPSAPLMKKILEALETKKSLEDIGGIFLCKNGRLQPSSSPPYHFNPASKDFPVPARHHLSRWLSTYTVGDGRGIATYIVTSYGCPRKCTFCSIWKQYEGSFFQRDIDSIIDELSKLDEYPVVRFADANTVVSTNFAEKLFDRIIALGIKKDFIMDIRVDTAVENPELIEKMARGGLRVVICGFESWRDDELQMYNKGMKSSMIAEAIRIFHENSILVRGNYVIPPWYDESDFDKLADFASSHRVEYAGYTILTPMPGTPLFEEMKNQIIDFDMRKYNFFNSVLKTKLPLDKFYEKVATVEDKKRI